MDKQTYEHIKDEQLQQKINTAFEYAVASIKVGNRDPRIYISVGLDEPYRSQVWQQALTYCGVTANDRFVKE